MRIVSVGFALLGFVAGIQGCAEGTDGEAVTDGPSITTDDGSATAPDGSKSSTDGGSKTDATSSTDGSTSGDATTSNDASQSDAATRDVVVSDAPTDSPSGNDGGPTLCPSSVVCANETLLGTVSGDTDSTGALAKNGYQSTWVIARATEDDSFGGRSMRLELTLSSPPGVNYDLFAYMNTGSDTRECRTIVGRSTKPDTQVDVVALSWGDTDGPFGNGSNDGRDVAIEIRNVSGTCAPAATWSLQVRGNR